MAYYLARNARPPVEIGNKLGIDVRQDESRDLSRNVISMMVDETRRTTAADKRSDLTNGLPLLLQLLPTQIAMCGGSSSILW